MAEEAPGVRAVMRYACALSVRNWAKFALPGLATIVLLVVTQSEWLLPLAITGMFVLLVTGFLLYGRLALLWRCSRVVRVYPTGVFRAPVEKVELLAADKRLVLRLGGGGGCGHPIRGADAGRRRLGRRRLGLRRAPGLRLGLDSQRR